ncbi:MAG: nitroreductase family protein, partial [Bdellovibrionota bacterium]
MALQKKYDQPSNAVLDSIYQRRAVRSYSKQTVSKENITALLDAANQAPSAMNRQPWGFIVIQDRALLTRISDAAKKRIL